MVRRTASGNGVVLSHVEFGVLWEDLEFGEQPYPLEVGSHGVTEAERDELALRAYAELAEAGLLVDDELDPGLAELLELLTENRFSVDVQLLTSEPLRVLAASSGRDGVFAVLSRSELVLEPMAGDGVIRAISGLVGELTPGRGEPVSMPRTAFAAATAAFEQSGYLGFESALGAAGVTGRALRAVTTLIESPRTAIGQLAASGTGGRRSPVLNWFDTEAGRYLVTVQPGDQEWITVEPADQDRISRLLAGLIDQVTGR